MSLKRVRPVAIRIVFGITTAILITGIAFRCHFNLSSATSVHLFLIAAIALKWGFIEGSAVSVISVGCLDYFFTDPLFHFYITDSHDWVALLIFEGTALLVSSLSSQLGRHARELERRELQQQALYELSQHILLLGQDQNTDQQLS